MMKFLLGYFYQVRFMTPNMIPVSTAISDPKWYHDGLYPEYTYFDKNGVINGLRCPEFAPGPMCTGLCNGDRQKGCEPNTCDFLRAYRLQLEGTFDVDDFLNRSQQIAEQVQEYSGFTEEPIIVLLVHEAHNNPCSERQPIIDFLNAHGVPIEEFHPADA